MTTPDEDEADAEAVRAFQGRMADVVARAVAAEREACAKIAEAEDSEDGHSEWGAGESSACRRIAEAIRARK